MITCFVLFAFFLAEGVSQQNQTNLPHNLGEPFQQHRPPQQTSLHESVCQQNIVDAQKNHWAARSYVLELLGNMQATGKIKGLICENDTPQQLLDRLAWEFKNLPLLHNVPIRPSKKGDIDDDTDFFTTVSNGYIQNVCQRYLMGVENKENFDGCANRMVRYMNFPAFKNPDKPTLRECNDRILYVANNWEKLNGGNFIYGSVTFVINPLYADKMFIAPYDTGAYTSRLKAVPYGTPDYFFHLIQPHLEAYQLEDLTPIFWRWYGWGPALKLNFFYFEAEMAANAWFPESILYVIGYFSDIWGTPDGEIMQDFLRDNRRPLIWADGDDSGQVIDPNVNWVAFSNPKISVITPEMSEAFRNLWAPGANFYDVYALYSTLQFQFPNYDRGWMCDNIEGTAQIMGTNARNGCVFWYWTDDVDTMKWECLNDGKCERSLRGVYSSEENCLSACGDGNWACQQNPNIPGNAGENAAFCIHDPQTGNCPDIDACEAKC